MLILGLDTSTTTGGVAIITEERLIANYQLDITVTHSARLFPAIDVILRDVHISLNKLDGIAVAVGPGSFTGLRIGVAAAKSLAYLNKIPLIGISTLDALAFPFSQTNLLVCSILDALRGEVYAAIYKTKDGKQEKISDDIVISIPKLLEQLQSPCLFTGNGIAKHKQEIQANLDELASFSPLNLQVVLPSSIAELGMQKLSVGIQDDPLKLEPRYLRRPEAEIVWEKKLKAETKGQRSGGQE